MTAPKGTRNTTLNRAAFRLGQLAGALDAGENLELPLLEAARAAGLHDREARATIASGLTAGALHPRAIPSSTQSPGASSARQETRSIH